MNNEDILIQEIDEKLQQYENEIAKMKCRSIILLSTFCVSLGIISATMEKYETNEKYVIESENSVDDINTITNIKLKILDSIAKKDRITANSYNIEGNTNEYFSNEEKQKTKIKR